MRTASDRRWAFAGHVLMLILSALALAPFALLIISSFTDEGTALQNGYSFFPEKLSLDAYKYLLGQWETIGYSYVVSIVLTLVGTVVGVSMAAMFGYTLSHKELPGRKWILFLLTFAMLFRGGPTATYIIYTQVFHVKDTFWGLLLPNLLMNGYNVMLFRNYFENSIPGALVEAAYIDGAKESNVFWKIIIPLSLPMVATVGLNVALGYWNDWMNGLYYISAGSKMQSIQSLLNRMNENIKFLQQNDLGVDMAAMEIPSTTVRMAIAVVGILPILFLYPIFQKWFVHGMTTGAVKE